MKRLRNNRFYSATAVFAAIAAIALTSAVALAAAVTIIVNGETVTFDQPPVERAGRVFVPLRGVFERLGASVVYDNGQINATGNGRTITLHVGSNAALVNGQQVQLDVAPFLIGSRTLVPLRFVSQALGANVDYDNGTNTVRIAMAGAAPTATPANSVSIVNAHPASNAATLAKRPAISGDFSKAVDPNTVHVSLDGRDVSSTTYVSSSSFLFSPPYDLIPATHTVRVTGQSTDGVPFDRSWSFVSGTSTVENYITSVTPADGASVGTTFTLSGTTLPNSHVHIAAVGTADMGGIFRVTTGSFSADLTADANGRFSQQASLNSVSGGDIGVRITSVAPNTNAATTVTVHYHT